ncbi:MAG: PGF-pre-PGF domain-containing protein [Methanolobus sp.]|nr:PGF-pre-PGF domain-containing protein [Methanolobus sp.]
MHKKRSLFLILVLLSLFVVPGAGNEIATPDGNSGNTIFLRTATINTDHPSEDYGQEMTVSSNSIEKAVDDTEKYYIVQFNGPVFEEQKDEMERSGAVLYDYLPDNAFIVKMNGSTKMQLQTMEFVKWIGKYQASYKYEPAISVAANQLRSESEEEKSDLLVLLFDANDNSGITEEIIEISGDVIENSNNILRVKIAKSRIDELATINGISWIEEYGEPVLFNDVAAGIVGVTPVHDTHGLDGSGQIVAVSDSGLDTGNKDTIHEDLRGRIIDIYDIAGDGSADYNGHGTHVAGSIAGNAFLSNGQYAGMAPEAELVFQAIGTYDKRLDVPADLNDLFLQAYNTNASTRIHSNSWGYTNDSGNYSSRAYQVDKFVWEHPDMLILFAAGNQGKDVELPYGIVDTDSITPPATAKNCLTVGASENNRTSINTYSSLIGAGLGGPYDSPVLNNDLAANNIEGVAAFSSRGPTDDSRIKPDVVAPGTFIRSTKSSLISGTSSYTYMSGTSMATPIVAGSAALVRQYYTDIENLANPSAALLKATLINGAHDMTPGQYGTEEYQEIESRPDNSSGWGRVDVENSLFAQYPDVIAYFDKETIVDTGDFREFNYGYIKEGEPLRATLVWTDYPAAVFVGKVLVNNLDLTVTGIEDTYYGNYDRNNAPDTINNVEGIEIDETVARDYNIKVNGTYLPYSNITQDFSLVLSFTCNNNEFPTNGSSTDDSKTVVSTDVVHPLGVNLSSIQMTINGSTVVYSTEDIPGGYRIYYDRPIPYQNGEYNVSVTAQTVSGQQFSYGWKFNMNALPVSNHPPVLDSIEDKTVSEGNLLTITLSANDDDGDELTYSKNVTFGTLTDNVFTWTPDNDKQGTYYVEFTVSDEKDTDSKVGKITVNDVNRVPEFEPIASKTIEATKNLQFIINATDSDGDNLTYSKVSTLPEGATFNNITLVFNWTPSVDQKGTYDVNFTVTDGEDNDNLTVQITVKELATATTPTTSSSSRGGGGGGGGTTGEDNENIEIKDVSSMFVGKDTVARFGFKDPDIDIMYVEYTSLKNAGTISVTIESLKDRSGFADSLPSGVIYRNLNIWVGKTGYAITENIRGPIIAFRVDRSWIREEVIDEDSIVLNRYSDDSWEKLPTQIVDSDEDYLYFETKTPGFSPFAITGERASSEAKLAEDPEILYSTPSEGSEENNSGFNSMQDESEVEKTLNSLSSLLTGLIICFVYPVLRKK